MPARTAQPRLAALLGTLLALSVLGPAAAQETVQKDPEAKLIGHVIDGRGDVRPVWRLAKSETPLYSLVRWFYSDVFHGIRTSDDKEPQGLWKELGIEPYSPAARSIMKAALRAEALFLDIPLLPSGVSDQEFLEAQHRSKVQEVGGMRQITLQMLRELKEAGYPLEVLGKYIDEKVRARVSTTIYEGAGGDDGYYRKFLALQEDFGAAFQAELKMGAPQQEEQR